MDATPGRTREDLCAAVMQTALRHPRVSSQLKVLVGGVARADDARSLEHMLRRSVDLEKSIRITVPRNGTEAPSHSLQDKTTGHQTHHELHWYTIIEEQESGNNAYFEALCYMWVDSHIDLYGLESPSSFCNDFTHDGPPSPSACRRWQRCGEKVVIAKHGGCAPYSVFEGYHGERTKRYI